MIVDVIQAASGKHTARAYTLMPNGCYNIYEFEAFEGNEEGKRKAEREAQRLARKYKTIVIGIKEVVVFT